MQVISKDSTHLEEYDVSNANPQCGVFKRDTAEGCELGCDDFACCQNSRCGTEPYQCCLQLFKVDDNDPGPGEDCPMCGMEW